MVQAEFSSKLIRGRKIYPQKMKSYLMDMQMVRNDADYSDERVRDYPNNNLPALTAKYAEFSAEERRELCGTPRFTLRSLRSVIYWRCLSKKLASEQLRMAGEMLTMIGKELRR